MNKKVFDFYLILKEEKETIENFSKKIKLSGELSQRINMVIGEMNSIKKDIIKLEENINIEKSNIVDIEEKINNITMNETKENIDLIIQMIIHNLPKDIQATYNKDSYEKSNNRVIGLMKSNDIIGEILIYKGENNESKVKVKLWIEEQQIQEFTIKDKFRIFNIISFINTNLSF